MNALTRAARWKEARRILAVRLDNLGDVLMTTPALRALRESVPGRHIILLASAAPAREAAWAARLRLPPLLASPRKAAHIGRRCPPS
ncbi:glycosyltransferase family 9 protein [Aromatoleum anaerobium]|uniref:glycosyltransferase family 9 protein n=1 Tax=Aromatoleum anaerobium TaxID=182180 RepID=UPI001FF6601E|nr:hypothetical protein [Aromatoleum anaerobium]MCK0508344.1 hypothetical protein [Aromatoleum anaerobium]